MKTLWTTYKSSVLLLASMIVGGVIGYFWGPGAAILQPVADTFLNLLYCCVVPLIFCSLTAAIAKMKDLSKLKKIMSIFLAGTFITGIISCIFMLKIEFYVQFKKDLKRAIARGFFFCLLCHIPCFIEPLVTYQGFFCVKVDSL